MIQTFNACNVRYAGTLHDAGQRLVVVEAAGFDVFSVVIQHTSGTFATAAVAVRYANAVGGPWVDFDTAITLNSSTTGSGLVGVVGAYIGLIVTTGEAADGLLDVAFNLRRSEIPTEVKV
jgi:hypothetical protein